MVQARTRTLLAVTALTAALLAGCTSGADSTSSTGTSTAPVASETATSPSGSGSAAPSGTASGSQTPTDEPSVTASLDQSLLGFQLCSTVLGLSAAFLGQVPADQLAEAQDAADQARAEYVDDGSGLAQKADAVLAAVEFGDATRVASTTRTLATACRTVNPGT